MLITLDNAPSTRWRDDSVSSLAYSHVRASGSGALYVAVYVPNGSARTGATYAGQALAKLADNVGPGSLSIWRIINPASGANNVFITTAGTVDSIQSTSLSLSGAIATTINTHNAGADDFALANPLAVGAGSFIVIAGATTTNAISAGANTTSTTPDLDGVPLIGYYAATAAGTYSLSIVAPGEYQSSIVVEAAVAAVATGGLDGPTRGRIGALGGGFRGIGKIR